MTTPLPIMHFCSFVQNAGRNKVKDELFAFHHQGVPGVIAALEPDYVISIPGKQINDFALTLITPLGAYYNHVSH